MVGLGRMLLPISRNFFSQIRKYEFLADFRRLHTDLAENAGCPPLAGVGGGFLAYFSRKAAKPPRRISRRLPQNKTQTFADFFHPNKPQT